MTPTLFEIVVETDTDFALRMGGNRQPSLGLDALLPQIDVLLGARVDNFDVCPLTGTGADDCSDNHERVIVCWIPETFLLGPSIGGKIELDGMGWKGERQEEEEEREPEETRHGDFEETNDHMRLPETRKAPQQNLQLCGNPGYTRQSVRNPGVLCPVANKTWLLQAGTGPPQPCLPTIPIVKREHTCYVSRQLIDPQRVPVIVAAADQFPARKSVASQLSKACPPAVSATGITRKFGLKIGRRQVGSRKLPVRSRNFEATARVRFI